MTKNPILRFILRLLNLPEILAIKKKKKLSKASLDHELRLYSGFFPNGFLHYGYFEDINTQAGDVGFSDVGRAQQKYADRLIALIEDTDSPVLDVGCGMGGISFLLDESGHRVVSLTPDKHQVAHILRMRPGLEVVESKFEDYSEEGGNSGSFGTILTSESLQYLDLQKSLPKIKRLLKPGGIWIACDYFRINADGGSSGHVWSEFCEALDAHGLKIKLEEDITDNVLPTLEFASMIADRFISPVWQYTDGKFTSKMPVLRYLFDDQFSRLSSKMEKGLQTIDPAAFKSNKKYVTLVIESAVA